MYPIRYIKRGNRIIFHYSKEDWNEWNRIGKETGNSGPLLKEINGLILTYFTYGTNDNPFNFAITLQMVNLEAFDGKIQEPEWYLKPAVYKRQKEYLKEHPFKFMILDVTNNEPEYD